MQLTIPQATYFQVVFTLPDKLSSLALGNRAEIYDLLFETAWASLRAKIQKDLGIQAAGVAVLHTWNQRLGHHPHVHLMVPGSGPSLDGQRWVDCRMEWCRKTKRMKPFLVDNKELGHDFRNLFLDRLTQLVEQGKIRLEESGIHCRSDRRVADCERLGRLYRRAPKAGLSTEPDAKVLDEVSHGRPYIQWSYRGRAGRPSVLHGPKQEERARASRSLVIECGVRSAMVLAHPAEGVYEDTSLWRMERIEASDLLGTMHGVGS